MDLTSRSFPKGLLSIIEYSGLLLQILNIHSLFCSSLDHGATFIRITFSFVRHKTLKLYGWGSTASRLEALRGGSLLLTTKFPEIPGTHLIDLGRMKD